MICFSSRSKKTVLINIIAVVLRTRIDETGATRRVPIRSQYVRRMLRERRAYVISSRDIDISYLYALYRLYHAIVDIAQNALPI